MAEENISKNARDIAVLSETIKGLEQRLSEVEELTELVSTVKELTVEVRHLGEGVKDSNANVQGQITALRADIDARFKLQGERLGALEGKSSKKWDSIVDKVLMVVVGAVMAFMLSKLGM